MNLTLNSTSEQIVRRKVESGDFPSPEDVVNEALRLLDQLDEASGDDLRREIDLGIEEARRGELIDGEDVFEEVRRRLNTNGSTP